MWFLWVLLGFAVVAMVAWLWQLDGRSRDAERMLKDIHDVVLRLDQR